VGQRAETGTRCRFHEGNEGGFSTHESCNRDYRAIEETIRRLLVGQPLGLRRASQARLPTV